MIVIDSWYGRNGNNIIQIINAIYYAQIHNHTYITFPSHNLLNGNNIIIENIEFAVDDSSRNQHNFNNQIIKNIMFYLKQDFNIDEPEPYIMKKIFTKYIKPIFKIIINPNNTINNLNEIYIHIRGGDIFGSNPHSLYVQPPLSYYNKIIENYDKVILVSEDTLNPCVNELIKNPKVKFENNSLETDIQLLGKAENLIIGFGTFGFLLYLMNPYLKNIYIPDYFRLYDGSYGENIHVHIIDLPNYINVGEWKNTKEQRNIMLNYK
jgi:hypothetical protein